MTTPQIRAHIEDGPRAGESFVLDAEASGSAPKEILLPDGHLGSRPEGGAVPHPTGAVSRDRLVGDGDGDRDGESFRYKVVPHDK